MTSHTAATWASWRQPRAPNACKRKRSAQQQPHRLGQVKAGFVWITLVWSRNNVAWPCRRYPGCSILEDNCTGQQGVARAPARTRVVRNARGASPHTRRQRRCASRELAGGVMVTSSTPAPASLTDSLLIRGASGLQKAARKGGSGVRVCRVRFSESSACGLRSMAAVLVAILAAELPLTFLKR